MVSLEFIFGSYLVAWGVVHIVSGFPAAYWTIHTCKWCLILFSALGVRLRLGFVLTKTRTFLCDLATSWCSIPTRTV